MSYSERMKATRKDHSTCSGCSLCLLSCPVWRQTGDIRLTPHGRAKAMQHGAGAAELARSVAACTLCGACEPACPEGIPLVELMLELRRGQPLAAVRLDAPARASPQSSALLVAGRALRGGRRARAAELLGCAVSGDDGADISLALEAGAALPADRRKAFLAALHGARTLVVADGLLLRSLRAWLPGVQVRSLGEALTELDAVRLKLRGSDLYVIEPRAFNGDHARLLGHYDRLQRSTGCTTSLDLQRIAVPTAANAAQHALGLAGIDPLAQARWIIEGRRFERVVVEDAADCAVFAAATDRPVVHLADLA